MRLIQKRTGGRDGVGSRRGQIADGSGAIRLAQVLAGLGAFDVENLIVAFRKAGAENLPKRSGFFQSGGKTRQVIRTPENFASQLFGTIERLLSPPASVRSPLAWQSEARIAKVYHGDRRVIEFN